MTIHIRHICRHLCGVTGIFLLFLTSSTAAPLESDPVMRSGSGRELLLRGEYDKGIEKLREAFQLFPLNTTLKRNLADGYAAYGHHHFKQKRYEQADENFIKAVELFPEDVGYIL